MKLEIYKKGCGETITLDIEHTASVNDLMHLIYLNREEVLDNLPFEVYQNVITLNLVDLYSDNFETKLEAGTMLADYDLSETTQIILDNFTHDNFFFVLNRINSNSSASDLSPLTARLRANFFSDGNDINQARLKDGLELIKEVAAL